MKTIKIIDSGEDRYTIDADSYVLGRRYDNNAEKINIIIPETEKDSICVMIVTRNNEVIDHIIIENNYIDITGNLTQYESVNIGFSFSKVDGYIKNSEIKRFTTLPAQKPDDFIPVEPEQKQSIEILSKYGFVSAELDNNMLVFKNALGNVASSVQLSGFIQEQSDWNETNNKSETYIKNKPTKLSQFENDNSFINNSEIIQRETLETATADTPDFIQDTDGLKYKKKDGDSYSYESFGSGGVSQTDFDNVLNNTTKIENSNGGFSGGEDSSSGSGGAIGNRAYSNNGGAIGSGAKTGAGFAGGLNAKTVNDAGLSIDAIQLGTGTNSSPKTLQVYNDNIYDANTHNLTVTGEITDGTNSISIAEIVNKGSGVGQTYAGSTNGEIFNNYANNIASGTYSHAEGSNTTASGNYSHAEGGGTLASGNSSHAGGYRTIAGYENQTAIGTFNDNKSTNLFEIGNGTSDSNRSNAFEVSSDGIAYASGQQLATEEYVNNLIGGVSAVLGDTEDLGV